MNPGRASRGLLAILLFALPAIGQTPDVRAVLNNVTKAMGSDRLKTLQYSGSGSIYTPAPGESAPSVHKVMKRYSRDLDLQTTSSREQITSAPPLPDASSKDQTETRVIGANSPWTEQYAFWMTPYGFLKGATSSTDASAESRTVFGEPYTVVTFTVQDKYRVVGFINGQNTLELVETAVASPAGETLMEVSYHDYADFGGVKVPTTIVQKQAGALQMVLIVREAKPNQTGAASSLKD